MYFANLKHDFQKSLPIQMTWVRILALHLLTNCLSLDDFLDFSMPQFLPLYDGDNSINDQMS